MAAIPDDALPRLIVKLQYPQACEHVTGTNLDNLLADLKQSVSGYICTLQASVNKDPAHESALKSAVKYVTGDYSTQYCRTATEVPQISSITHTILIEVLTNAMSVPLPVLDLIEEKVKYYLKSLGDQNVIRWVGVSQMAQPKVSKCKRSTDSGAPSFVVRFQYPQCCVPVTVANLDAILYGIQKIESLWNYECSLEASVSALHSPAEPAAPEQTTKYCKSAPPFALKDKDELVPTILIEFFCSESPPSNDMTVIEETVIRLITENISQICDKTIRIRLFHLSISS